MYAFFHLLLLFFFLLFYCFIVPSFVSLFLFLFFLSIFYFSLDTIASKLYGEVESVSERHRHRYEVNPIIVDKLEHHGLLFSGKDVTNERMEIIELNKDVHPYFLAVQFHPEFKSRPQRPSPVFLGFLQALKNLKK